MSQRSIHQHLLAAAAALACFAPLHSAWAQAVQVVPGTVNIFRDTRGANDIGSVAGDRLQFGASVKGGAANVTMAYVQAAAGLNAGPVLCQPLLTDPGFCARTTAFNANRFEPWTLTFARGVNSTSVQTQSLYGAEQAVPFASSVTLTGARLNPTLSWQVPGGFQPDAVRVNIFDKSLTRVNGSTPDLVHSVVLAGDARSYVLPSTFNTGRAMQLGGQYTIAFQLIETRGHVPMTSNNNAFILRRSQSYFAFTPLSNDAPPNVVLPTVTDTGIYQFSIESVGPNSVTFIDPDVAVGYDYAKGQGDPNFASVLLPDVGDGNYVLAYDSGINHITTSLAHGTQYFFPSGGVASFSVTGIEVSAMLDPLDSTAFITGLTWVSAGKFTGTMTPITQFVAAPVPEPETYALMLGGLGLVGLMARRRRAQCNAAMA